jgi:hypothetical protein
MCALLALELLERFCSCSVFKSVPVIGRLPVNMNTPAPETGPFRWAPQKYKKCLEKLIACFPLIRHEQHRKRKIKRDTQTAR